MNPVGQIMNATVELVSTLIRTDSIWVLYVVNDGAFVAKYFADRFNRSLVKEVPTILYLTTDFSLNILNVLNATSRFSVLLLNNRNFLNRNISKF